ncbi:hypothetical protein PFLA_a4190 [Pseudoalteromonas flavipulchra NCIMB 2033 = ATCC BAA-314]|nr:hypothetical protein [Pseudoalteromonas flavipulchra NCIMB 2033 = ATCC BAA-314]
MLLLGRVDAVFENDLTAIMELKALYHVTQVWAFGRTSK